MSMSVGVEALLVKRKNDAVLSFEKVMIKDGAVGIRGIFHPFEDDVIQVDINRYEKSFFVVGQSDRASVDAMLCSDDGVRHFLFAPILFVLCDDEKPVDMTEKFHNKIIKITEFY